MNSKDPVNQQESEHAALWSPEGRSRFVVQRQDRRLQELLREAQSVYVKTEEKKLKTDARILVVTVQEMQAALNTKKKKNLQGKTNSRCQDLFLRTQDLCIFSRHKKRYLKKNSYPTLKGAGPTCFYCH